MEQVVCDVDMPYPDSDIESANSLSTVRNRPCSDYNFKLKSEEKLDDNGYTSDPEVNFNDRRLKKKPLVCIFKQMRVAKTKRKKTKESVESGDSQIMQRYLNDSISYSSDNKSYSVKESEISNSVVSDEDLLQPVIEDYEEEEDINGGDESLFNGNPTNTRDFASSDSYESGESNQKLFSCKSCPKMFMFQSALEKHIKVKHNNYFKCQFCDQIFGSTEEVFQHEQYHFHMNNEAVHNKRKRVHASGVFECNICDKSFTKRPYLAKHLKRHAKGTLKRFNRLMQSRQYMQENF